MYGYYQEIVTAQRKSRWELPRPKSKINIELRKKLVVLRLEHCIVWFRDLGHYKNWSESIWNASRFGARKEWRR